MQRIYSFRKKFLTFLLAIAAISPAMAQGAGATAPQATTSSYNLLEVLMMIVALVLAFFVWGLGRILLVLGKEVLAKNKTATNALKTILVTGLTLASLFSNAQDGATAAATTVAPNFGGLSSTTFYLLVMVIATEITIILFMFFFIRRLSTELFPKEEVATIKFLKLREWWSRLDKKLFTRAVAVEKEADVMLDHNYDGIRELDNALPPWWKWGFYITIGVAFVYLLNFHVFGYGKNPTEEYETEMANAKIAKELYEANNKDKIDENNVPMADASGLTAAKEIFSTKCFACHGKGGEGGAGPNLTDDYWLHKGSLNDIYHTIKNGYPDKGMQSWSNDFSPKEISYLASYVKSLRGTNPPNQKAPQGDLYQEGNTPDSSIINTSKAADSSDINKKDTSVIRTVTMLK